MSWVFKHSEAPPIERLLLLALADAANADGTEAWPSIDELTRKTGMHRRTVHRAIDRLVEMGELEVEKTIMRGRWRNCYRILMGGDSPPRTRGRAPRRRSGSAPRGTAPQVADSHPTGGTQSTPGGTAPPAHSLSTHPEPSLNHPVADPPVRDEPRTAKPPATKPRKPREPDLVWDAVMTACAVDVTAITDSARGAYNKAVWDLKRAGATPDEIARRAALYRIHYTDAALTPTALARHWAEVAEPPRRLARSDVTTAQNAALVARLEAEERAR